MNTICPHRLVHGLFRNQSRSLLENYAWRDSKIALPVGRLFPAQICIFSQHNYKCLSSSSSPIIKQACLRSGVNRPELIALPRNIGKSSHLRGLATLIADHAEARASLSHQDSFQAEATESKAAQEEQSATPTRPIVAYHLFTCAALVYLIIVVGGLTRLTESGLSITEWNPGFKGMKLPWTDAEWDKEWEKYKGTPEWAVLNQHMNVNDFKKIYMWEWSHRILGRVIGIAVLLPTIYFLSRGYVARGSRWKLLAICGGIGFQGFLGWFMVKSGLSAPEATPPAVAQYHTNSTAASGRLDAKMEGMPSTANSLSTSNEWHPRVSQFRLAAHLGTAFLVYLGMLHTGVSIIRDFNAGYGCSKVAGLAMKTQANATKLYQILSNSKVNRFRNVARGLTALIFITAMSGALVAGLDAGLVYSEFPYMGNSLAPPKEELLDPKYAIELDSNSTSKLIIGNASQNPVTVQFMHRCLAMTTLVSALGLGVYSRRLSATLNQSGIILPRLIPRLAILGSLTATMQATLGISTLIYLVPIELASAHQAGSVALLSVMTALLACLRRSPFMLKQASLSTHHRVNLHRQAIISNVLRRVRTT